MGDYKAWLDVTVLAEVEKAEAGRDRKGVRLLQDILQGLEEGGGIRGVMSEMVQGQIGECDKAVKARENEIMV